MLKTYRPAERARLVNQFSAKFGKYPLVSPLETADENAAKLEQSLADGKPHQELVMQEPGVRLD